VGEEGEPPQHDPRAQQTAGGGEQHDLGERLAQEREIRQIERRGHRRGD
jgi:hypothetical protein